MNSHDVLFKRDWSQVRTMQKSVKLRNLDLPYYLQKLMEMCLKCREVFENRVLRGITGHKKEYVRGKWRKIRNGDTVWIVYHFAIYTVAHEISYH